MGRPETFALVILHDAESGSIDFQMADWRCKVQSNYMVMFFQSMVVIPSSYFIAFQRWNSMVICGLCSVRF